MIFRMAEFVAELPVKSSSSIAEGRPRLLSLFTYVRDLPRVRSQFRVHRPSIALAAIRNEISPARQDQNVAAAEDRPPIDLYSHGPQDGPVTNQKSNQTHDEVRSRYSTLNSSSELRRPLLPVSIPPDAQVLGPRPISEQVHVSEVDSTSESPEGTESESAAKDMLEDLLTSHEQSSQPISTGTKGTSESVRHRTIPPFRAIDAGVFEATRLQPDENVQKNWAIWKKTLNQRLMRLHLGQNVITNLRLGMVGSTQDEK